MSKLTYESWAQNRNEALPIGNGRIGAMLYGQPFCDVLALNEETLWSGSPEGEIAPYDRTVIAQAQSLLEEKRYFEAEALLDQKLMRGVRTQTYLPLGNLHFDLCHHRLLEVTQYHRELDLENAVHCTRSRILCRENSVDHRLVTAVHTKEAFVSFSDDVLVYHFESSIPITANISLDLKLFGDVRYHGNIISATGRCYTDYNEYDPDNILCMDENKESIPFAVKIGFLTNGKVGGEGKSTAIRGATETTVIVSVATGFQGYDKQPISQGRDYQAICEQKLAAAMQLSYAQLKQRHVQIYREQYCRTEIVIDGEDNSALPTDERIRRVKEGGEDNGLVSLLFDYGKYLLISSSQPGGQASNLQGIWNEDLLAPWNSNYTININTQMNYWAAEAMNLPECHLPLIDMLRELAQKGNNYGMRGWCTAHNTDIWRFNRMATRYSMYGLWDMGGVWLARHLYDHFCYTRDVDFLKANIDILRDIYVFLEDRLTEDSNGKLYLSPSTSPETRFVHQREYCSVTATAAMDLQIIEDYLLYMAELEQLLGCSTEKYDKMRLSLAPQKISADGRLLEYGEELEETPECHQHLSHLYGIYPGNSIRSGTKLYHAARKALDDRMVRGGGVNGWANIWAGLCYTRFVDGENAYKRILFMLRHTVYPNLLNICPPFQIDGNFGVCALICDMLLQGDSNDPKLLPAIPAQWKSGHVRGLKLRGGKCVSFSWKDGVVSDLVIE